MKYDKERLARVFTELCEISSPSKKEKAVADYLRTVFTELGASDIYEDNSAPQTGSDTGNIIVIFEGNMPEVEPLLLACHMDTVLPADGVKVKRDGDLFTSAGDTILGGDDKSGIAAIIEAMTVIKAEGLSHGRIELLFTTCEEIGLLGAKHLEPGKLTAKQGFALDSSTINVLITRAPSANSIDITIHGFAAHAGLAPETGVNALSIAVNALSAIHVGRHDAETTSNFGIITGGTAINIVPDKIVLHGEVRSHNPESLAFRTEEIRKAFIDAVKNYTNAYQEKRPRLDIEIVSEYPSVSIDENHPMVQNLLSRTAAHGQSYTLAETGGGSDANILNGHGITMGILGTGMSKVHTTDEFILLSDMTELTKTLYALIAN